MSKRILCVVFLAIAIVPVYSQTVSPLHQVMSANSIINRPQVFRDLQANLSESIENTDEGAKLDVIYRLLADLHDGLVRKVNSLHADSTGDSLVIQFDGKTLFGFKLDSLKVPSTSILKIQKQLANDLRTLMEKIHIDDPTLKEALSQALLIALEKTGATKNVDIGSSGGS